MTSAIMRAWMTTRIVSASPPSFRLESVSTLIGSSSRIESARHRSCNLWDTHKQLHAGIRRGLRQRNFYQEYHALTASSPTHSSINCHRSGGANSFGNGPTSNREAVQKLILLAADGDGGNDNKGMRHRPLVGDGEIDTRLVALGRDCLQTALGAAGECQRRTTGRQIDDTHVTPPHAGAKPGAQRLGTGFLGRKTLSISLNAVAPFLSLCALDRGEH